MRWRDPSENRRKPSVAPRCRWLIKGYYGKREPVTAFVRRSDRPRVRPIEHSGRGPSLARGAEQVFRIDPDMSQHHLMIDGLRHLPLLCQLGSDEAVSRLPTLAPAFFRDRAETFEPCHKLSPLSSILEPIAA
jgi:hypothetical protein